MMEEAMKDPDYDSFSEEEPAEHWELEFGSTDEISIKGLCHFWDLDRSCEICNTKPPQERGMTRDDAIERYGVWFAPFGLDGS
jgi:hypothetical protein